jgi:hypothetical protein
MNLSSHTYTDARFFHAIFRELIILIVVGGKECMLKSTVVWEVTPVVWWKWTELSEERIGYLFRVEE